MEAFINCLRRFGQLNQQQVELIKYKAETISIKKGDYFSEAGKIPKQLGFVTTGILRISFHNNNGEDFTRFFITENQFASDINSFYNETTSAIYIEAITDCTLLVLSKTAFVELADIIPCWNEIFTKVIATIFTNKLNAGNNMLIQDATTRYLQFLDLYPGLANRVPLSMLASFLGITPSSLSRIRKSIC